MSDRNWVAEPAKPTPVELDRLLILDSADSDNNKLVTLGSLPPLEFVGPWTANHDAGEFNLSNLGLLNLKIDNATAFVELEANHTTPTAGQIISQIDSYDDDSVGVRTVYTRIQSTIVDPTNGSESGELTLTAFQAGVPIEYITLNETNGDDITFRRDVDFNTNNIDNITDIELLGNIIFPDDIRQTFNPGVNFAGINVGAVTVDPQFATLSNGDLWYNSTDDALRARINGVTVDVGDVEFLGPWTANHDAGSFDLINITDIGLLGNIIFPDNIRQTFNPGADLAGINVGQVAVDPAPSTLLNGDLWYNTTDNELRARIDGASVDLDARFLPPVVVATIQNGALSTVYENGDTVDGVVLSTGDRILLKNQTTASENGVYTVNVTGAPTRTADFDVGSEILGATVYVLQGDSNPLTFWKVTNTGTIIIDTTAITFANAADAPSSVNIFSPEDFGTAITAPDGVSRVPLLAATTYFIHNTMVLPRVLIPVSTSTTAFSFINFQFVNPGLSLLCDGNSTPHIWGRDVESVSFFGANLVDIGNSGAGNVTTLFDLVGFAPNSAFTTDFTAMIGFKRVGYFVDMQTLHNDPVYFDNLSGFAYFNPTDTHEHTHILRGIGTRIGPLLPAMDKPFYSFEGSPLAIVIQGGTTKLNSGDDYLYFDSAFDSDVQIQGNSYSGSAVGNFFQASKATSITAQANADIAITSFSDSTENPGVDTTVNFGGIVDFTIGQVILIADEAAYDGTHTVLRVAADQQSFDINVVFSTAGAGTLKMVQHTVAANPHSRNDTLVISGTTNYNGTFAVLRETDTTFHLPQAFVADDATGTATSNPQNETFVGIDASGNGQQKDSLAVAEADSTTTILVDSVLNTFVPIQKAVPVAGDFDEDPATERFSVNTSTGVITYDGDRPLTSIISFQCRLEKTGGADQDIVVSLFKNAVQIPKTDVTVTVPTTPGIVALYTGGLFTVDTGDTFQLYIDNTTNSTDTNVSDLTVTVRDA